MADFTIKRTDEMETIFDGIVHRARASLGATSVGMQVMHFPPGWEGYPNHDHVNDSADGNDLGQEEIYIALDGSATLLVDGDEHALEPGVLARVGPRTEAAHPARAGRVSHGRGGRPAGRGLQAAGVDRARRAAAHGTVIAPLDEPFQDPNPRTGVSRHSRRLTRPCQPDASEPGQSPTSSSGRVSRCRSRWRCSRCLPAKRGRPRGCRSRRRSWHGSARCR